MRASWSIAAVKNWRFFRELNIFVVAIIVLLLWWHSRTAIVPKPFAQLVEEFSPWALSECNIDTEVDPRSYSRVDQDVSLWQFFYKGRDICGGMFLEVGAWDGNTFTVTKFYEENFKWQGILIEGDWGAFIELEQNRQGSTLHNFAICAPGKTNITISVINSNLHMNPAVAQCYPQGLAGVTKDDNVFALDIVAINVGRSDLEVMSTIDWEVPMGVVVVELSAPSRRQAVDKVLTDHGYSQLPVQEVLPRCKDMCTRIGIWEHPKYRPYLSRRFNL